MRYLIVLLISVTICCSGCGKKAEQPVAAESQTEQMGPKASAKAKAQAAADQASEDDVKHKVLAFNLEGLNDKGEKKWDVKGESAEAISENEIKLDNIVAKAYGEEAEAVITADKGIYDKTKNNVTLQQNVKATVESSQGFSGSFVGISDQEKAAAGASQGADGKKAPEAGKSGKKTKTIITCDGEVQFDYEKNIARFLDNVKVDSEDGTIESDKITVNLDPKTKQLKDITAEGNVRIKRDENTTYSQTATYDAVSKKVTLAGRPKLIIHQEGDAGTNFMGSLKGKE